MIKKPIIAMLYDYDDTLAQGDMQNFGLIPSLGLTPSEFWGKCSEYSKKHKCERILSFLYTMKEECKKKGIKCTRKWLNSLGKDILFFPGVEEFFKRINSYGKKKGVEIEHYIISSGNKEIIEGSKIAKEFKNIFACEYCYDDKTKLPTWPKLVINYTQKTQFVYRVAKGTLDIQDDSNVNKKTTLRIKHDNMIYLGDGLTDVPCMTVVKNYGGRSIAIYSKKKKDLVIPLVKEGRVNYACLADYRENSELDKVVKLFIDGVAIKEKMINAETKSKKKI